MLTLWEVVDASTMDIMTSMYRHLILGDPLAEALAKAVRKAISERLTERPKVAAWDSESNSDSESDSCSAGQAAIPKYTPSHWAPFIVCGLPTVKLPI